MTTFQSFINHRKRDSFFFSPLTLPIIESCLGINSISDRSTNDVASGNKARVLDNLLFMSSSVYFLFEVNAPGNIYLSARDIISGYDFHVIYTLLYPMFI